MTVETDLARVQYATNGTVGPWTVPFYFLRDADIQAIYADADGNETVLAISVDYSVTGAGDPDGGTITMVASYASGGSITILRDVEPLQETDYRDGDQLPAETLERNFDRLTMLAQQLLEITNRSLVFAPSDPAGSTIPNATSRALKLLGFDSLGRVAMAGPTSGSAADLALLLASIANATEGAGMVGYDDALAYPPDTVGAKLRTLGSSALLEFSPLTYGAAGDGVTLDDSAMASCSAAAKAAGGVIVIPAGHTFAISQNWNIENGVKGILGRGGIIKIVTPTGNAGVILRGVKGGAAENVDGCDIANLLIDCNNVTTHDTNGIFLQNASNCSIHNCRIFNLSRGHGILLRNYTIASAAGGGNRVESNRVIAAARNTVGAAGDLYGIVVDAEAVYGAYADAPELWKQTFTGPSAQQYNAGNVISDNRVVGGYYGFSLHGLVDSVVSGNNTQNNQRGFSLQNQSNGNVVAGNKVFECYSAGIHLAYGSSDNLIIGNQVLTSVGKGEALIQAYVGCKRNEILSNKVTSNEATQGNQYGIYAAVHADGTVIRGNTVRGRYYRASIGVESAWRTTLTTVQWHYGNGATAANADNYANAPTTDVVVAGNTIYCDTVTVCPPIYLGQIKTIVTGTAGYTSAYDAALTGTVLDGNKCIASAGSLRQLYLHEDTANSLNTVTATDNTFAVPDSAMSIATLATYMVLPRGRAHFTHTAGNFGLDMNNAAVQMTGATPNVGAGYYFGCLNGGATTITSLLGGRDGQELRLRLDSNTGISHSGGGGADSIRLANLTSITAGTATSDTWLTLRRQSGVWLEVARSSQSSGAVTQSYVLSETTSAISCANGVDTTVLWDTPSVDTLTEYSAGSGVFTAANAGTYLCAAHMTSEPKTWAVDTRWELRLFINGSTRMRGQATPCQVAAGSALNAMFTTISVPVKLAAGETVTFKLFQNQGGAVATNGNARDNWMSIARVA